MGGMSFLSQQLVSGPFASPGRKQRLRCSCIFPSGTAATLLFPGHLLVRLRRKGKGKRQQDGESRNEKEDEEGGEERGREKREVSMNFL